MGQTHTEPLRSKTANPGKKNPRDIYKVTISLESHNPAIPKNTLVETHKIKFKQGNFVKSCLTFIFLDFSKVQNSNINAFFS